MNYLSLKTQARNRAVIAASVHIDGGYPQKESPRYVPQSMTCKWCGKKVLKTKQGIEDHVAYHALLDYELELSRQPTKEQVVVLHHKHAVRMPKNRSYYGRWNKL